MTTIYFLDIYVFYEYFSLKSELLMNCELCVECLSFLGFFSAICFKHVNADIAK